MLYSMHAKISLGGGGQKYGYGICPTPTQVTTFALRHCSPGGWMPNLRGRSTRVQVPPPIRKNSKYGKKSSEFGSTKIDLSMSLEWSRILRFANEKYTPPPSKETKSNVFYS